MGEDGPNRKNLRYLGANSRNSDICRDVNRYVKNLESYRVESVKSEPGLIEVNLSEKPPSETGKMSYFEKILHDQRVNTATKGTEFGSVGLPVKNAKYVNKIDDYLFECLNKAAFLGRNGNDGHLIGSYLKNKKVDFDENSEQLASPVELIRSVCRGWDEALIHLPAIFLGKVRGHAVGVPIGKNKYSGSTH